MHYAIQVVYLAFYNGRLATQKFSPVFYRDQVCLQVIVIILKLFESLVVRIRILYGSAELDEVQVKIFFDLAGGLIQHLVVTGDKSYSACCKKHPAHSEVQTILFHVLVHFKDEVPVVTKGNFGKDIGGLLLVLWMMVYATAIARLTYYKDFAIAIGG